MNKDHIFVEQNMFFIRNINVNSTSKRNISSNVYRQPIMIQNPRIQNIVSQQEE